MISSHVKIQSDCPIITILDPQDVNHELFDS